MFMMQNPCIIVINCEQVQELPLVTIYLYY